MFGDSKKISHYCTIIFNIPLFNLPLMLATHTKRSYWIVHTAYWIVCEMHNLFIASYFGAKLKDVYVGPLVEFVILFTGTYFFWVFVGRYTFAKDWKVVVFLGVCVCFALSAIAGFLHIYFFGPVLTLHLPVRSKFAFLFFMYSNCLQYIYPWFGVFYIHELVGTNSKIIKKQSETSMSLQLAQLENLKNQLNPHFLFNSLNSIKALTLSNIFLAREAIIELAELLRTSLDFKNSPEIFLYQEIKLVEKYLKLEKIRFEDRLNYTIDMSCEVQFLKIPPMSVQLLVENAIKHGISNSKKGGYIAISGYRENDLLYIQVKNAGKITINSRKGIGLDNLDKRLELNYGKEAKFTLHEMSGEVVAEIQAPCLE